jgi:hypothetical protein
VKLPISISDYLAQLETGYLFDRLLTSKIPESMPNQREEHSIIRKLLPYTTAGVIIAMLYVGWIFFSRWQLERETQRRAAEQKRQEAQRVVDAFGGNNVKILAFNATPGVVRAGEAATLCYGVSNAKTVRIEPEVKDIWPSMNRCVDIAPKKDTTYTITAADEAGHTQTSSLMVKVQ